MDVARRVSPRRGVIILFAPLGRPCAVSPTVKKATTVLTSTPMSRAVGVSCSGRAHCDAKDVPIGGGCTVASPFGNNVADGKNCKTIHKVERVFCDEGSCKVLSCKDGYKVSRSHDSCVQPRLERVREVRGGQVHDVDSLLSLIVGHGLFVKGYDLVSAKERLNVSVKVFSVDHVLEVLLGEKAIIDEILDLIHLKARLELDVSV